MNSYSLYKARVVDVKKHPDNNKPEIFVSPIHVPGEVGIKKMANPPSSLPTSTVGSGMLSVPDVGQLCLVAESEDDFKVNIICYVQPDGFNPYGGLSKEDTNQGSITFKVGGLNKSVLTLDRSGLMSFYSNNFAKFSVNGSTNTISLGSKSYMQDFAGGKIYLQHIRDDENVNKSDITLGYMSFSKYKENPGFSDRDLDLESEVNIPRSTEYSDKTIIKLGGIRDHKNPESLTKHTFQLESRQSTGVNPKVKDTVNSFMFGYQDARNRFGDGDYPRGVMAEMSGKKNTSGFFSYRMLIGRQESDLKSTPTKGEVYRLQLLGDRASGTKFGTISDPVGSGKGYSVDYGHRDHLQSYILSVGKLNSGRSGDLFDSFKREYFHDIDSSGQGYTYKDVWFGESMRDELLVYNESEYGRVVKEDSYNYWWKSSSAEIAHLTDNESRSVTYTTSDQSSSITQSVDSVTTVYNKSGISKVELSDEKIVLSTGEMTLELSEDKGLVLNGVPLVYSTLVDFFNENKMSLGFSMGAPVPFSPTSLEQYSTGLTQPFTNAKGFKTG